VTDACPEPAPQLDLRFALRAGRTVLEKRLFRWPFALTRTFHLDRAPAHMLTAILQTSSGAVHADDRLTQNIHVGAGAAAHVTTQGASPVHRAARDDEAVERIRLNVEAGGYLEYLPEPKILFPGAALSQTIALTCDPDGCALASDAFLTHDPEGRGRDFRHLAAETILRGAAPEPWLIDRLDIEGLPRRDGRRAAFRAFGTLYAMLPRNAEALEGLSREMNEALAKTPGLYAAASPLPSGIGVSLRLAAEGGAPLRQGLETGWRIARRAIAGEFPAARRK
jgi:urease accessory protein